MRCPPSPRAMLLLLSLLLPLLLPMHSVSGADTLQATLSAFGSSLAGGNIEVHVLTAGVNASAPTIITLLGSIRTAMMLRAVRNVSSTLTLSYVPKAGIVSALTPLEGVCVFVCEGSRRERGADQ